MSCTSRAHLSRLSVLASGALLLLGGSALAQSVAVFDDAPSIEQLRSIMIPESRPSMSRSIVIQRPDTGGSLSAVQPVSTEVRAVARAPAAAARTSTPSQAQAAVSAPAAVGMPVSKPTSANEAGAVAFHVNFAFNSAELPDTAQEMIGRIAQLMQESPEIKVRVEGHTDAAGSANYNVALSERRALSVGEGLVKRGVDPSRLVLVGKGMAEPLTHNKYDPANRRVQFVRIG